MKNYLSFNGLFWLQYAYVDANTADGKYVADSLFYRHKVPVKFGDEFEKDGEKYIMIFCKIRKKYKKAFEKALAEIPNKMDLMGFHDYRDFCTRFMQALEQDVSGSDRKSARKKKNPRPEEPVSASGL